MYCCNIEGHCGNVGIDATLHQRKHWNDIATMPGQIVAARQLFVWSGGARCSPQCLVGIGRPERQFLFTGALCAPLSIVVCLQWRYVIPGALIIASFLRSHFFVVCRGARCSPEHCRLFVGALGDPLSFEHCCFPMLTFLLSWLLLPASATPAEVTE